MRGFLAGCVWEGRGSRRFIFICGGAVGSVIPGVGLWIFLVPVVSWSVVGVGPVLSFLGCNEACRGRMAHRPGSRCDPPFTDSCGPSGWWLVVLCSQQCLTTYNVNYRGEGFRAFLKVGGGDARGRGCVGVLAPCGACSIGLHNVVPNFCGV